MYCANPWYGLSSAGPKVIGTTADPAFAAELAPYLAGKATLRFPLDQPIPGGLIERVVTLLAQQRHGQPG